MTDLAINLLASAIAGIAVWLFQRVARGRSRARRRAFYGVRPSGRCWVSIPQHVGATLENSVHRRDLAAVVEVAAIVKECGGEVGLDVGGRVERGVGEEPEFCLGGPVANPRAAAHLRRFAPGVTVEVNPADRQLMTTRVGSTGFERRPGRADYVLLARINPPAPARAPLWLVCGQTAQSNQAAARWLSENVRALAVDHGPDRSFCLVLRLVDADSYGAHQLEPVGDYTAAAFTAPDEALPVPGHP